MWMREQNWAVSDLQTVLGAELFATSLTVKRTVSSVFADVCLQTVSGVERSRAPRACVRASSCVLHHVLLQVRSVLESPTAHLTHLGFFPGVDAFVHLQSSRALEHARAPATSMPNLLREASSLGVLTHQLGVTTENARLRMLRLFTESSSFSHAITTSSVHPSVTLHYDN